MLAGEIFSLSENNLFCFLERYVHNIHRETNKIFVVILVEALLLNIVLNDHLLWLKNKAN